MATDPADYERDPNRRDVDEGRAAGWGVAVAAIIIVGLIALMVSRLWTGDEVDNVAVRDSDAPIMNDLPDLRPPAADQPALDHAAPAAGTQQPGTTLTTLGDRFDDMTFNDHREKPVILATSVQPAGDVAP